MSTDFYTKNSQDQIRDLWDSLVASWDDLNVDWDGVSNVTESGNFDFYTKNESNWYTENS